MTRWTTGRHRPALQPVTRFFVTLAVPPLPRAGAPGAGRALPVHGAANTGARRSGTAHLASAGEARPTGEESAESRAGDGTAP